jgi:hypothetical protein
MQASRGRSMGNHPALVSITLALSSGVTYHREDSRKDFDLLRQRSRVMNPVQEHRSLSNHKCQVKLGINLPKTIMWSGSKNQPVLSTLDLSIPGNPALGIENIGIWVDFWIAERWIGRWDNHGA